jgi:hypothetical protein
MPPVFTFSQIRSGMTLLGCVIRTEHFQIAIDRWILNSAGKAVNAAGQLLLTTALQCGRP